MPERSTAGEQEGDAAGNGRQRVFIKPQAAAGGGVADNREELYTIRNDHIGVGIGQGATIPVGCVFPGGISAAIPVGGKL